jgi:Kef-type K+ transport system membrane component KefB
MFSLLLLAFIMQGVSPITNLPLLPYMGILLYSVYLLKQTIPSLTNHFFKKGMSKKDRNEKELRFVLVILMAVLIYFSALGVHPIVAAFIVGLLLSDVVESKVIHDKLHTMGYGLFVPVFFFIIGMQLDLTVLFDFEELNSIMIAIIVGLLGSKYISGYLAGRYGGFSKENARIFGISSMSQLTTTLAVVYAASNLGLLDNVLTTSIIVLAIISTTISPLFLRVFVNSGKKIYN